jgi:23S rRNA (adenine2503-C2)-methyltransferase
MNLLGKTLDELQIIVSQASLPTYAAKQIADWVYKKRVTSIGEMTNIAQTKRDMLAQSYALGLTPPVKTTRSADGTVKYLFATAGDKPNLIESVFIPSNDRATLCVSSQAGCKMNCVFCRTGKQGFASQLTANEILNQIHSVPESKELTNIVFMGMGEPLDNIDELLKVLEILTSPYGYAWSPKRITVSTIGLMPGLKRFLDESDCHLAISLHSPYHKERLSLTSAEKVYPVDSIIDLLHNYDFSHQRRVSFEYIMFEGVNDSERHAQDVARLLRGIPCRVNLIRFHAIPGVKFRSSSDRQMEIFRDSLNAQNVICTIRASRGEDVFAACGMLSGAKKPVL